MTPHAIRSLVRAVAATVAVSLGIAVSSARADTVAQTNAVGTGAGIEAKNVRIRDVLPATADKPPMLVYVVAGNDRQIELTKVWTLTIDDDKVLTDAELAYRAREFDKAVDGYQKVARGGTGWKVRYVTPRLVDSANRANRFDAAISAYLAFVRVDPAGATAYKPALPAKGSKLLEDAAAQTETALRSASDDTQRRAYLSFLLDVHTARSDDAARVRVLGQLEKLVGDLGSDPASQAMLADIRLAQARSKLAEKQFAEAIQIVDDNADRFVDPRQQAAALFTVAEAKAGLAKPADADAQLDVAVAYMKVVANYRKAEGAPYVVESLMRAAAILEAQNDLDGARGLYESVATDYPDHELAKAAQQKVDQLKKK
jgi:TolA-binding protein